MIKTILRILIVSAILAAWELYLKYPYYEYMASVGQAGSFGATMLGYAIPIFAGYIIAWVFFKKLTSKEG